MNETLPNGSSMEQAPRDSRRGNSTLGWLERLAKKELLEILRDRRTVITLVLMPLLVYPLLSVAFRTLALHGVTASGANYTTWYIEFDELANARLVDEILGGELEREELRSEKFRANAENLPAESQPDPGGPVWQLTFAGADVNRLTADVQMGIADLAVRVVRPTKGEANPSSYRIELISIEESPQSRAARDWFAERLRKVNDDFRIAQLRKLDQKYTTLVEIDDTRTKPPKGDDPISFAALMPLILVLMTITGAVYPAIDLTAGERERNTLEALIASPAPRIALLLAKYSAVLTVAMLTALMNLLAMSATIWLLGLGKDIFGARGFSILAIVQVGGLLMLFAAFFSGVLLAVTSFARSFKEAQAYLIPLMLLSLGPGMMSLMPGIKLEGPLVVAPLVNLVLLTRDLLLNKASNEVALIVVVANALYAVAAIAVAARVFGADSVLYGREGSWSELFRRPREKSETPSAASGVFCLAALFVLTFLAQSAFAIWFRPAMKEGARLDGPIIASGLGNLLIFGGVCLAFAWLGKVSRKSILPLRAPSPLVIVATMILGLCSWPLAHEILAWMSDLKIVSISQSQMMRVAELLKDWQKVSPAITLLAIAVITPIGEEIAFRGYLYSAFQPVKRAWRIVPISAALFAAFHVVAPGILSFERFAPSFALGLLLGYVRYQSGSLWPSLVIHIVHNGLLMLAVANKEMLAKWGLGKMAEDLHLPTAWWVGSLAAVAVGIGLVWLSGRRGEKVVGSG